jgi:O-antigen/teichoic acid export membrane protein
MGLGKRPPIPESRRMEKGHMRGDGPAPVSRADTDTPLRRIARNSGWLFSGKLVAAALSFFYLALVTRTLGPAHFGLFILIVTTVQFIKTLLSFDSWQAVVKYGQPAVHDSDRQQLGRLTGLCLAIDIGAGLIAMAIALSVLFLFGDRLGLSPDSRTIAAIYTIASMLAVRSTAVGLLRLVDRFAAGAFADTMSSISRMAGAILAAIVQPDVTGFLLAWAMSELVVSCTYWIMVRRYCGPLMSRPRVIAAWTALEAFPGVLRFLVATNFASTLRAIVSQGPVLLVGGFAGVTMAGFYRLATQLASAMALVAQMVSRSIFTEMARSRGRHGAGTPSHDVYRTLWQSFRLAIAGAVVIAALLLFAGKPFLLLMAGRDFLPAYPLLLLLGFATVFEISGVGFAPLLLATDRARLVVYIQVGGVIVLAILLAALLPSHGAQGAAIAVLTAAIVQFGALGAAVRFAARTDRTAI